MPDRRSTRRKAEKVGYKQPPRSMQFRPGQSGNPKGRPKGSKSIGVRLRKLAEQKVTVTENGKTKKLPAIDVVLRRVAQSAMKGDPISVKLFLALIDRYGESSEVGPSDLPKLLAEDEAIFARYLKRNAGDES